MKKVALVVYLFVLSHARVSAFEIESACGEKPDAVRKILSTPRWHEFSEEFVGTLSSLELNLAVHLDRLRRTILANGGTLLDHVERVDAVCAPDLNGKGSGSDHNRTFIILRREGLHALRNYKTMLPTIRHSLDWPRWRLPRFWSWARAHKPFTATVESRNGTESMYRVVYNRFLRMTRLGCREERFYSGGQIQYFERDADARDFSRGGRYFAANPNRIEIDEDFVRSGDFGHRSNVGYLFRTESGKISALRIYKSTLRNE